MTNCLYCRLEGHVVISDTITTKDFVKNKVKCLACKEVWTDYTFIGETNESTKLSSNESNTSSNNSG